MKLCGEGEMDTNQRREKSHIEFPTVRDDQGIFFFFSFKKFLATPWDMLDLNSPTRGQTPVPCSEAPSLNHCTSREGL